MVDIHDDHVEIHAGDSKSVILVNNDGSIKIKSTDVKVEATNVEVKGSNVNITGGILKTGKGGTAAPTSKGGFCAIPVCPLTGAPHIGDVLSGT